MVYRTVRLGGQTMYRDDLIRGEMAVQQLTDEALAEKAGLTRQKIGELRTGKARDPKLSISFH